MAKTLIPVVARPGLLLLVLFALPLTSSAHRLDEYLQATLVTIEPGTVRLQMNLTPGVAVAKRVLSHLDRDHDDAISAHEATEYCQSLKHDLVLRLDGRMLQLTPGPFTFPPPSALQTGLGIIQVEFSAVLGQSFTGCHKLSLRNRHLKPLSVYLFNAAQPESAVVHIFAQSRNKNQSWGEIIFSVD